MTAPVPAAATSVAGEMASLLALDAALEADRAAAAPTTPPPAQLSTTS